MFRYITLLILAITSHAFGDYVDVEPSGADKHIIGGSNAPEGSRPFQVSLGAKRGNSHVHFCGGAIIDEKWVLTAAHCTTSLSKYKYRIKCGTNSQSSGGTQHDVNKVIIHEQYSNTAKTNDIALIQIKDKFQFNDKVKAIALSKRNIGGGINCVVSGWGYTNLQKKTRPDKLQMLNVKTLENERCAAALYRYQSKTPLTRNHICTYKASGQGFCQGDSGGPLTCNNELVGIVSVGVPCATGVPDVYTRVSQYIDWINKNKK